MAAMAVLAALLGFARPAPAQPTPAISPEPQLERAFERADSNGDGRLSEDEARKAGFFSAESFSETDTNRDGTITLFELGAAVQARFQGWVSKHTQADLNRDGYVSRSEAEAAGHSWSDDYERADRNHDGQVSREELMYRVTSGYYSETRDEPLYPNIIDRRF
jgi:Ca2+-binding EF-hand superfamily protein